MLRSNWLFLVIGWVCSVFVMMEMIYLDEPHYDLSFVVSICGILSLVIQIVIWIVNLVRWAENK